ncbi:MAG: GNAT family N-acetyltransferase [Candidatus Eremiobacteraeota bacterium]|nr:GNAT family N-acetyltransferase [Candidatus Eremiobacteraeota bacterium]
MRAARTVRVRPARENDARAIASLMAQLGYRVPPEEVAKRLRERSARREVFVAVDEAVASDPIGWAAVSTDDPFVEGFGAELEGLVVAECARSHGVGACLIEAAEVWARERGCAQMRVRSNVVRKRALGFYQRHGYSAIKAQNRLIKPLGTTCE